MRRIRRYARFWLSACLGACTFVASADPQGPAVRTVTLDIKAQAIGSALNEFARQSGIDVLLYTPAGNEVTVSALIGTLTADEALEKLLENTGLTYSYVGTREVAVYGTTAARPAVEATSRRAERPTLQLAKLQGASAILPTHRQDAQSLESRGGDERANSLAEIVVVGSHIRGLVNNTAPVTVLDRTYIESTGVGTTAGLIESLPQNFSLASPSGVLVPGVSDEGGQGTSINLRGVSEGTTLVLLNGRRLALSYTGTAADISALPVTAIERVEVLTDGASALYGSDAVGGVVNFVTRSDFQGAEIGLRHGWASSTKESRASLVGGRAWSAGNALVSMEYYTRDLLKASDRNFVPPTSDIGSLFPEDENYSILFSGRQQLAESLSIFADAIYMNRDSYNEGGRITQNARNAMKNPQSSAAVGVDWDVAGDWQVRALASYAHSEIDKTLQRTVSPREIHQRFEVQGLRLKADGAAFTLPGRHTARLALGAEWRSEDFSNIGRLPTTGAVIAQREADQTVTSLFGEAYIPVVESSNDIPGVNQLELSLAGRYDDYSSFGSSFDPRVGMMWEPVSGLRIRGSYGTSYVAPRLNDYSESGNFVLFGSLADPSSPTGISGVLLPGGINVAGLVAQEARSYSVGFELTPNSLDGFSFNLNYFDIEYKNQIASPPNVSVMLGNPASYGSLITRNPSIEEIDAHIAASFSVFLPPTFDHTEVDAIVDLRRQNLSVTRTNGIDLSASYNLDINRASIALGLTGTYLFERVQQVTNTSAPFDTISTFANPPHLRLRGNVGWQYAEWAASFFINYTDSYTDNRISAAPLPVSSFTTVDARLAYDLGGRFTSDPWSGVTVSISAQNLLDSDPPHTAIVELNRDMGFDPTNASPMGRLVAVEFSKRW